MELLDLLGRRWALRILWELRAGPRTYGELQADEISTSVLATRLRELVAANIVSRDEHGAYVLTPHGRELGELLMGVDAWARRWKR
jgi:DNA-binding HxlR family transcriptional regulator